MKGFWNRFAKVDLTHRKSTLEPLDDGLLRKTLGGKGLCTRLLLEHNPAGVDPLSPENHILFSAGPLAGTPIWGGCRHGVFTKSPQTGLYAESYSGGTVAEYMARTGIDALMVHGAARDPVWLEVSEGGVTFHDAGDLWGLDTFETEDRVKAWVRENRPGAKNGGVICIGPAGENGVSFAVIENDYWRSAGRTGVGAVLGSKKIKALAFHGQEKKETADPEGIKDFVKQFARAAKEDAGVQAYNRMGTPMMVDIMSNVGSFPTRYWHQGKASHQQAINADALHSRLEVKPNACLRCFIACGRLSTVKEGPYRGLKIEGPEYETIYAFGGLCEVPTIEEVAYLNDICDRLGLDTISAGNLVAFTMEASRKGRVDLALDYGQTEKIAELLEDMAHRRGVGDLLARGIRAAAREWGMEGEAIHVKGLEPAGYDPRVLKGMGLAYGTSPRGACHLRTTFYKPELARMIDPDQIEGKARMLAEWEDRLTVFDSLIFCRFYRDLYQWEQLGKVISLVTGLNLDREGMRAVAQGILDDTRRFNLREGLDPADDRLPRRFYEEALPETGKVMGRDQMEQLLRDYYRERGWDEEGRPPQAP